MTRVDCNEGEPLSTHEMGENPSWQCYSTLCVHNVSTVCDWNYFSSTDLLINQVICVTSVGKWHLRASGLWFMWVWLVTTQ